MKRPITSIFRVLATLAMTSILVLPALAQGIAVQLDGRTLQFDQPPAMIGGRLLVPLRGIFEALKADVVYDGPTRSIQATKGSTVVQLQLGSKTAVINGRTLILDVAADTVGGRTMVPLRFVSESLGADVKWDGPTKTVRMTSSGGVGSIPTPPVITPPPTTTPPPVASGPSIDRLYHSATSALKAGDALEVVLYGAPGCEATFEILGATNIINMPEVSPGKYQVRYVIPNGLRVNKGVLLAHLKKNGRETAEEAKRQVTILAQGTNNPGGQNQNPWSTQPAANGVVGVRAPLSLTFPADIQPQSVRFFVDGVNFTQQVRVSGRTLSWTPNYNLSTGNHQAQVQATDQNGRLLRHSWNYRVDPNQANNPNTGAFAVRELRPAENAFAAARPQIGAIFTSNLQSVNFTVDQRSVLNQPGSQKFTNGVLWTPNYNLSNGQHTARVQAVSTSGQRIDKVWTFHVGQDQISSVTFSPATIRAGQNVQIKVLAPSSGGGTVVIGNRAPINLRQTSNGLYEAVYMATTADQGTATITARLNSPSGRTLSKTAATQLRFQGQAGQLSITNLRNGMGLPQIFNVQGRGAAGRTVTVLVEYQAADLLGALSGKRKQLRNAGTVRSNGTFDIPFNTGAVRPGQTYQMTVSDGQSPNIVMNFKRQ